MLSVTQIKFIVFKRKGNYLSQLHHCSCQYNLESLLNTENQQSHTRYMWCMWWLPSVTESPSCLRHLTCHTQKTCLEMKKKIRQSKMALEETYYYIFLNKFFTFWWMILMAINRSLNKCNRQDFSRAVHNSPTRCRWWMRVGLAEFSKITLGHSVFRCGLLKFLI